MTKHENRIQHENQNTWRTCTTWKLGQDNTPTAKQSTGQYNHTNYFPQETNMTDQHTRGSRRTKHWVYKRSKTHMTCEAAIHVVELSSPKIDKNIHNGWESTIWSTESSRKLQQGTQSGMENGYQHARFPTRTASCQHRPHNLSIKLQLWDFPWPPSPTRFLWYKWNRHKTLENKGQMHRSNK